MDIREKIFSSVRYQSLSKITQFIFNFIIIIILARVLEPEVFGIFAMATIFTSISDIFIDFGTSDSIIRHDRTDKKFLSTIFWFNTIIGLIVFIIMISIAGLVADFFGYPIIRLIIIASSIKIIFTAMGIVPKAILMRRLNFKALFFQQILVTPIAGITAIILALNGFGIWSIVIHQIIVAILGTLINSISIRWIPKIYFELKAIRQVFSFSTYLSLSKILNYFTKKGDLLLIGKYIGAFQLGIYSKGYHLMLRPLKLINGLILPVLYPVLSKIQKDTLQLQSIYLKTSEIFATIYFPLFVFSYVLAEPLVLSLLGVKWIHLVPLVPIFSAMSLFLSQSSIGFHFLKALGKTKKHVSITFISSIVTVVAFIIGLQWGIIGVAIGYLISIIFQYVLITYITISHFNQPFLKIILNLKIVFICSMALFLGMQFMLYIYSSIEIENHWFILLSNGISGLLIYSATILIYRPQIYSLVRELLLQKKEKHYRS